MPSGNTSPCQALLHDDRTKLSIQGYLRHPKASDFPRTPSVRDSSQLSESGPAPTKAVWKCLSEPAPLYTSEQVSPLRRWEGAEGMTPFHAMPCRHAVTRVKSIDGDYKSSLNKHLNKQSSVTYFSFNDSQVRTPTVVKS